ncbi:thioredoxin O2, mitochondrial-like [Juglans microcarpa x Juglans regia]|uniref:thioredoxin O2, mitochondrial-like n=1 Tax=Juglans microcarpa x Juglans regia TaxID=2249226 RepID=UPI001B7E3A77|nr:thioredoxin O2, mitochondrial-like [Juglans microcarpa x Juglans regia]
MARSSILRSQVLRQALGSNKLSPAVSCNLSSETLLLHLVQSPTATGFRFSKLPFLLSRPFSSSSGPSNILLIKSENEFNSMLGKVQDESLPAVFYFTAVWCGPCRFISPLIEEFSEKYPHVKTYKIDIDQEGLGSVLSKLQITSVPTLHFFKKGIKAAEVIGADVARLKDTMEKLYKTD